MDEAPGSGAVAEALGRLCDIATLRQPDDPLLVRFLPRYYSELPADDVDDRKLDDIYAVAVAHLALGRVRRAGTAAARVLSPERDRDGWHSPHSVVLVVTDDMPFLVDTIRLVLERRGLGVHLLVHPVLRAVREDDRLVDVAPDPADGIDDQLEAWTQIEIDRTDATTAAAVEAEILQVVDEVQRVVDDFPAMHARMEALSGAGPILAWLAAGQFVFLGAADYDVSSGGHLTLRSGSELGLARGDVRAANPRPMPAGRAVTIARTDDVSTVFRGDRQTVVAVDAVGGTVQSRFIGLLATNAYRVSVLDIPGVGDAVALALDLTPARMHAHTGRATRTVLENLPRSLVLELDPSALARLVTAIVGLQERQLVRAFEVPEPVGRWVTVLVYLPRDRFTAELPERVADAVAHVYAADARTFETDVGASSLARIAVGVRRVEPAPPVDLDALERRLDELSTSWSAALRTALVAEVGEQQARALFEEVGAHAPPAYVAAVDPKRAIGDVRRIAELVAGDAELTASLGRDVDAGPGEWRFRVYRQGAPAALSELLPLLDHLGLQALDERPYTFRLEADRVFVYDIGVRVASDIVLDDVRRAALQEAFTELLDGSVEGDSYNRLVLLAGLTVREVALVRALGKYLRQIGFTFSQAYVADTLSAHPRLVADLVALFHARFDPGRFGEATAAERQAAVTALHDDVTAALDAIPSLDDDRICRAFLTLIDAAVRTNFYRDRPAIALKFDPAGDPGAAAAAPEARDLGVRATRRGRAPARRGHRTRGPALERPAGGLPHRGARPDEGPDGQERGDRAQRRQGRVRRQATADGPRRRARRGRRVLPGVHPRPARPHRQPRQLGGQRRWAGPGDGGPPTRHRGVRRRRHLPRRRRRQGHGDVQRHRQRDRRRAWLLARRRVRLGGSAGYDHKAMGITARGRVGERAPPCQRPRQGRRPRPADGGGDRRHVGRRLRQRHAALERPATGRRVRPPPRLHRSRSGSGGVVRRASAVVRAASIELGGLRPGA